MSRLQAVVAKRTASVATALFLLSGSVRAEAGAGSPPLVPTTPPNAAPGDPRTTVRLVLHGDSLPADALRAQLEQELGTRVSPEVDPSTVRGTLTITFHRATHELVVSWDSPDERTVTRAVTARDRDEDAMEDAVLLAGNLARDEADDIAGPKVPTTPPAPAPRLPATQPAPPAAPEPEERLTASASFFYPLATDAHRRYATSPLDFNLLYGRIGGIDGAQVGLVNVVGPENGRGVGSVKGFELGAIANIVEHDVHGFEAAWGVNSVGGDVRGIQLGVLANFTTGSVHGAQAGVLNDAGDVSGIQLGLVNIARNVRGVTIGLVNIADDVVGLPIAPISVTKSGGVHPVAWSGTSGLANAGVKFATRHTYTAFFGAYHRDFQRDFGGGGLVIGGRIDIGSGFHADVDVSGTYLIAPEGSVDRKLDRAYHEQLVQPRLRLSVSFRAARHFGVFLGCAAVGQFRSELDWDRITASVGPEVFGGVEL